MREVEPLGIAAQEVVGVMPQGAVCQAGQAVLEALEALGEGGVQRARGVFDLARQLLDRRGDGLCRGRGRGAAAVCHHVCDGVVWLVADTGDDGDAAAGNRAGELLVVEGHEVLVRAAATHEQDDVWRGDGCLGGV